MLKYRKIQETTNACLPSF